MNWGDFGAAATVIAAAVTVVTLFIATRNGNRERAEKQRAREAKLFDDGAKSRDVEIAQLRANAERDMALMRSQRDDARRDRDENGRRADRYEGLYNELRDRSR